MYNGRSRVVGASKVLKILFGTVSTNCRCTHTHTPTAQHVEQSRAVHDDIKSERKTGSVLKFEVHID